MKYLISFLIIILFFSCKNQDPNSYQINGSLENITDAKMVYLSEFNQSNYQLKVIDSSKIENGKFSFKGITKEPENTFFRIDSIGIFQVLLEPGELKVVVKKNPQNGLIAETSGAKINDKINQYKKEIEPLIDQITQLRNQVNSNENLENAYKIQQKIIPLQQKIIDKENTYIKQNPDDFYALMLIDNKFQYTEDIKIIESLYNSLTENNKKNKLGTKIYDKIKDLKKVSIGQKAQDFSAKNPDGISTSLYKSLGEKVTIVDFWASWCVPCRQENPNLVKLYNNYKNKGLNIISISLDENKDAWIQAIKKDNLNWVNISNLKSFTDEIASAYQINAIPATFILDQNGIIRDKNLRGIELDNKIKEMIK